MTSSRTRSRILIIAGLITAAVMLWWLARPDDSAARREVNRLFLKADYEASAEAAERLLKTSPDLVDICWIAAQCHARLGRVDDALHYLERLPSADRNTSVSARLLEAELAADQLYNLTRAENAYRAALQLAPNNLTGLQGLVRLLSVCGRRQEALPMILKLVQLEQASDLLTIAARASGAINDPELLSAAQQRYPDDVNVLTGLALLAERSGDLDRAILLSRQAVSLNPSFVPAHAALGQYLLAAHRFDDLDQWNETLPPGSSDYAQTWRVKGYLAEHHGQLPQSLEYFLRAVRQGPELRDVYHRISRLLQRTPDQRTAALFSARLVAIQRLETLQDRMFETGPAATDVMIEMIDQFCLLGRLWEARGWTQLALASAPNDRRLRQRYAELARATAGLPLTLVSDADNLAATISAADYDLPTDNAGQTVKPRADSNLNSAPVSENGLVSFRDDAAAAGVQFLYVNGVDGPTTHRMFEFTGGGIGVADFDGDDFPDLFLSQGGLWPPGDRGTGDHRAGNHGTNDLTTNDLGTQKAGADAGDILYRNLQGERFADVSALAGITDTDFGQGVAVGDINSDGFPDIFVANIGPDRLWLNNGDGTFTEYRSGGVGITTTGSWTTSAVIADLTGDGAADIFAAGYLGGNDVFDRTCGDSTGHVRACVPTQFDGVPDSLYVNNGDGIMRNASARLAEIPVGKGLGAAVWAPDSDGRLSLLVANDTTPNILISLSSDSTTPVTDTGFAAGLAVNGQGKAEGCMGIAVGDVDNDGGFELLVTNFYNESNTFYDPLTSDFYQDRTASVRLEESSLQQLGFGTQFVDADLDGQLEVMIANGHVDDLRWDGRPYQMPAQCFRFQSGVFHQLPPGELGNYFNRLHIGRSVVCVDWNVDRRPDLVVGHLAEPCALLTNVSEVSDRGASLRLIGTRSARDPIGATVTYQLKDRTITRQLTAGDGYHASSQHELWLGTADLPQLQHLLIRWPSGEQQSLTEVAAGGRYIVTEGRPGILRLP